MTLDDFRDAATVVWRRALCYWTHNHKNKSKSKNNDNNNGDAKDGGGERGGRGEQQQQQLLAELEGVLVPIIDLCGHRDASSSNARVDGLNGNGSGNGGGGFCVVM